MKIKFKIHLFYYLFAILSIITGHFKDFILISLIIFVHELGHVTVALFYKWKIEKIVILPFGGITIFNEYLNKPIKEELLISIMGPIYQIIFYYIICLFCQKTLLFSSYHYALLLFNLLPIIPLDGSKICKLLLEKFLPYKLSHIIVIIISSLNIFVLFILALYYKNLILFITLFFLMIKILKDIKEHKYIFNKFLFERYLYNFNFRRKKIIKNMDVNGMMRDKRHLFYNNYKHITEKEVLNNIFNKNELTK